ncbi:LysR family transcriptional regulator [Pseudonocardia alaniniphila]|uniref:LysR family transcriptional regulator n=1 Tax=Pseudonocardia alaniniphila TaxID=75291 RepID=A0ABS9TAT4_9PSEU|nr:LysR family transcriptional regulator [Pseudonocardia alaniniphila]MCH6165655.1 LysR family transcriptional regulator [Pseudonocardia alaniniphila]
MDEVPVEVRQLRYFVAVAEELHFGRAAERLAVAQPAVSQQVGRLERELGVRLLERTSRRVALTGDGERLLVEARSALAAVDRVRAVADELAAGHAGTLRLGTSPGLGERVRRGVARMRAHTPELSLVLTDGSVQDHCSALRAGALDVALVRGPIRVRGLHAVELWRDRLHVVLPADHPDADQDVVPISALDDLALRLPERSTDPALHDAVLVACRAAGFVPRLGRPVRSIEDALVEIGLGERTATVVLGCAGSAAGVVARPLDPPVEVPGHLLLARAGGPECLQALVTAFGD